MKGFIQFIREQGVMGLAIGFILGGAISQVVNSLVTDLVNPLLGLALGSTKGLEKSTFLLFHVKILYGHFLSVLINFIVISAVIYGAVKLLRFEIPRKKK